MPVAEDMPGADGAACPMRWRRFSGPPLLPRSQLKTPSKGTEVGATLLRVNGAEVLELLPESVPPPSGAGASRPTFFFLTGIGDCDYDVAQGGRDGWSLLEAALLHCGGFLDRGGCVYAPAVNRGSPVIRCEAWDDYTGKSKRQEYFLQEDTLEVSTRPAPQLQRVHGFDAEALFQLMVRVVAARAGTVVDPCAVSLGGFSMGASGTWDVAAGHCGEALAGVCTFAGAHASPRELGAVRLMAGDTIWAEYRLGNKQWHGRAVYKWHEGQGPGCLYFDDGRECGKLWAGWWGSERAGDWRWELWNPDTTARAPGSCAGAWRVRERKRHLAAEGDREPEESASVLLASPVDEGWQRVHRMLRTPIRAYGVDIDHTRDAFAELVALWGRRWRAAAEGVAPDSQTPLPAPERKEIGAEALEVTDFGGDQSLWIFLRQGREEERMAGHDAWTLPLTDDAYGLMDWLIEQRRPEAGTLWTAWASEGDRAGELDSVTIASVADCEPTEEEIGNYAHRLGLKPGGDDATRVARQGLATPLPFGWRVCLDEDCVYYYNFDRGERSWDHPADDAYRELARAATL